MLKELKVFYTAIMFYTRLPVPSSVGFSQEILNKSTRYFTLIGILVGSIGALVFQGAGKVFSIHLSVILTMALMTLVTGAFHEDGFSDFCDGFGGGYSKEQRLSIMKDSRIGTYGALSLIMITLSKFFLLAEIGIGSVPYVLIAAQSLSRLCSVYLIFTASYVRVEDSKSKPIGEKHSTWTLIIASCFGLLPLIFLPPKLIPFLLMAMALIVLSLRKYVIKRIGGYTGDVLGALQQISETGFYLVYLLSVTLL